MGELLTIYRNNLFFAADKKLRSEKQVIEYVALVAAKFIPMDKDMLLQEYDSLPKNYKRFIRYQDKLATYSAVKEIADLALFIIGSFPDERTVSKTGTSLQGHLRFGKFLYERTLYYGQVIMINGEQMQVYSKMADNYRKISLLMYKVKQSINYIIPSVTIESLDEMTVAFGQEFPEQLLGKKPVGLLRVIK
ncbi:MAG: hypothetical protein V1837_05915 [Candidatus Woesearchaeota archaeon]